MNRSEIRKIGGSDIAAILGLSKWKSAHSLYLHLIGELPPQEDNPIFERGRILEPVIANIFAANHDEFQVVEAEIFEDKEYPFLIGSPDRFLVYQGSELDSGLEIKTADATKMNEWGDEETDQIPVEYLIQCQWYCGLCDSPDWYIAVGFVKPGSKKICGYREYRIEHDVARFEAMKQKAVSFWHDHVEARVPPEITEPDAATVEYYKRRERIADKMIYTDEILDEEIAALRSRQNQMKEAERMFELEKTRILAKLGNAEGIIDRFTGKNALTFKEQSTTTFDHKALCADLELDEKVMEKYRRQTHFRVLRLAK